MLQDTTDDLHILTETPVANHMRSFQLIRPKAYLGHRFTGIRGVHVQAAGEFVAKVQNLESHKKGGRFDVRQGQVRTIHASNGSSHRRKYKNMPEDSPKDVPC